MTDNGKRVLLVEDNEQIMEGNRRMLLREGFDTPAALTLAEARAHIAERKPDAIVLDIMLPDGSGLDFMRELRESKNCGIPTLLLTGLTTKEDTIRGLKAGGDDYLTKPYDFSELMARIDALLRRAERVPDIISKGRLTLDVTAGVAAVDGIDLLLNKKEFALLLIFVQNEERVIDNEYLYERVWKSPMANDSNALNTTMSRLRPKIKGSGWCIVLSKGVGYCFERE
jgi:DNA-binding response OmpR family regulator